MGSVIESWLISVANAPGLSNDYIERGKTCISKVFSILSWKIRCIQFTSNFQIVQLLKRKCGYRIRRYFIGGSVGKSTTTTSSDFDCYIFIDDIEYPFKNVLMNIGNSIRQNQPIGGRLRVTIVIETPTVLTCAVYENGEKFKVDFSIAKSYATDESTQQKKTLDAIRPWPSKVVYKMNGGLSQAIVRYVQQQDDFTRSMLRLTKHWFDSLKLNQPNSKTMVEFLAIHCAQLENKFPTKSILRCFMGLLQMIENFDQLDIVFRDDYKFPDHQFDEATTCNGPSESISQLCTVFPQGHKIFAEKILFGMRRCNQNALETSVSICRKHFQNSRAAISVSAMVYASSISECLVHKNHSRCSSNRSCTRKAE